MDTKLRELSKDSRSLDDFCRLFFGVQNQKPGSLTYEFEDVVEALSAIADFDWSSYFHDHLAVLDGQAPIGGIAKGGYILVYREEPSAFQKKDDALTEISDLRFSIGVRVKVDGTIEEVIWDSPAFQSGATAGSIILAINSRSFSLEVLEDAIARTPVSGSVELMVKRLKHTLSAGPFVTMAGIVIPTWNRQRGRAAWMTLRNHASKGTRPIEAMADSPIGASALHPYQETACQCRCGIGRQAQQYFRSADRRRCARLQPFLPTPLPPSAIRDHPS